MNSKINNVLTSRTNSEKSDVLTFETNSEKNEIIKSKTLTFPIHTILVLVGPNNIGKSDFARKIKEKSPLPTQILSSDEIRREILGRPDEPRDSIRMKSVSTIAFNLLFDKLKAFTQHKTELIIIDSTGMSEKFRNQVCEEAKKVNYHVGFIAFIYNNKYLKKIHAKRDQYKQYEKIKDIKFPKCHYSLRVRKHSDIEFSNVDFTDLKLYQSCQIDTSKQKRFFIIGDTHGCVSTLKTLLVKSNLFGIENGNRVLYFEPVQIVMLGDYVDRGLSTKEMLEFLDANTEIILIKGNHEENIYKALMNDEKESMYSSAYQVIRNECKDLFLRLYHRMVPFVSCPLLFASHVPVNQNIAGVFQKDCLKKHIFFKYRHESDEKDNEFKEARETVKSYAEPFQRPYFFGHIPFSSRPFIYDNQWGIDTGVGQGWFLTGVKFPITKRSKDIVQVRCKDELDEKARIELKFESKNELNNEFKLNLKEKCREVSEDVQRKAQRIFKDGHCQFISGTVSPSDMLNSNSKNELECIETAFSEFKKLGHQKVVIQPKYMGSRCQIYLFPDISKCYATSRSGFTIKSLNEDKRFYEICEKLKQKIELNFNLKSKWVKIIIDGELLPWNYMGKSLINEFDMLGKSLYHELNSLRPYKELYEQMLSNMNEGVGKIHGKKMSKGLCTGFIHFNNEWSNCENYLNQMQLYGRDGPLTYKPFDILKIEYEKGYYETKEANKGNELNKKSNAKNEKSELNEILPFDAFTSFTGLNDEPDKSYCLIIELDNDESMLRAKQLFEEITHFSKGFEGIVVKPLDRTKRLSGVPFLKVRNPEYLRIIYGPNYTEPMVYSELMSKKNTTQKKRSSIKEWYWGIELLKLDVQNNDKKRLHLMEQILSEEKFCEENVDQRL